MPASTYLLMGIPFLVAVLVLDIVILRTWVIRRRRTWVIMAHLFVLTLVFNQFLAGWVVGYNPDHQLGIRVGFIPIEDFTYTIAAVIGIGALVSHDSKKQNKS